MLNRATILELIRQTAKGELKSEIAYHMSIEEREYAYDELSALLDVEQRTEQCLNEAGLDKGVAKELRALRFATRRVLIEIGYYRALTQFEIANTWSSSGVKWAFKLGGIPYDSDDAFEHEQFPEEEVEA